LLRVQQAAGNQDATALNRTAALVEKLIAAATDPLIRAGPWSLFNPEIMARHRQAISQLDPSGPLQEDQCAHRSADVGGGGKTLAEPTTCGNAR
jgi:hypothetical protein